MNKTAKEMFEELGYELGFIDDYYIGYDISSRTIQFELKLKRIKIHNAWSVPITSEELKAIQKQSEELGW